MIVSSQKNTWKAVSDYLLYILQVFTMGGLLASLFAYLNGYHSFRQIFPEFWGTGLLTVGLFLGNGLLANHVPISWTKQPKLRLFVSIIGTIIVTLIVSTLTAMIVSLVEQGDPFLAIKNWYWPYHRMVLIITAFISLFLHGRGFLFEYRQTIEEKEALKRTQISSRLESLQNQINPHFLFNSLNVLSTLVHEDADKAEAFIQKLSGVYRYVLAVRDTEVVSLEQELEALEAYLYLLQIRFGEALVIQQDIEPLAGEQIPPLCLQMLLENAVKHNVASRRYPLQIKFSRSEEGNYIAVWNNLRKKDQKSDSLGIGLQNIRERYNYLSDQSIQIEEETDYFRVLVPILYSE